MASSPSAPSSDFEGDFAPGEVLIGRYRIVALLGEGGMGQVYLADDLVLGQPVAVKFLPRHVEEQEGALDRFRAEVRHAREVTHPNVARVHDIGEVDGRHFLTMEFVDGEDLASLIRRIGRLPREKAAEISQQICAGLAEAHRKGVLHRDLKPANVMLDGEGRVRLTDFGLAVTADADAPMAGTPPYMAPEQLSGVPATVRSEVYSLGLLLYELHTGKRALRGRTLDQLRREHEERVIEAPSSVLEDIDPAVDAVLTRCLARDPEERPASVSEVARALPGGDPLAAAIAAGETPSPDVVAAADLTGALAPRFAMRLVVGALLALIAVVIVREVRAEREGITYGKAPAVLHDQASGLVARLTGVKEFPHELHWSLWDNPIVKAREGGAVPGNVQPLVHHSRYGFAPIFPRGNYVSIEDPAMVPGSAHVALTATGQLVGWSYEPREPTDGGTELDDTARVQEETWRSLLEEAGFALEDLERTEPSRIPPVYANERLAWRTRPGADGEGLRVEAAGAGGVPVHLQVLAKGERLGWWSPPSGAEGGMVYFVLTVTLLACILAWRNIRSRRAHLQGALWIAVIELVAHMVYLFGNPVSHSFAGAGAQLFSALSYSLQIAFRVAIVYLALEPYARRCWPQTLIAWTRLFEGRLRDPSVGREVLIGATAALLVHGVRDLVLLGLVPLGIDGWRGAPPAFLTTGGALQALCHVIHLAGDAIMIGGVLVFLLVLLRSVVRSPWLAAGGLALLGAVPVYLSGGPLVQVITMGGVAIVLPALLARVGFLSIVTLMLAVILPQAFPLTLDPGEWVFSSSLVAIASLVALIVWSYRVAVGGKPLLG